MVHSMDKRYHGYVNFSPSSSVSSTTVEMMGPMGNSLVRIYDKTTGNLRTSYWQQEIDLTENIAAVCSLISNNNDTVPPVIDLACSSSLSSSSSSSSLSCNSAVIKVQCVLFNFTFFVFDYHY